MKQKCVDALMDLHIYICVNSILASNASHVFKHRQNQCIFGLPELAVRLSINVYCALPAIEFSFYCDRFVEYSGALMCFESFIKKINKCKITIVNLKKEKYKIRVHK